MHRPLAASLLALATLAVAACGSSSKSSTATSPAASGSGGSTGSNSGLTIDSAPVGDLGTVLVNARGMTLYVLSSEKGNKVTCTDADGCTKVWPDNELPAGVMQATAGPGVQASLLGTATGASGDRYASYAGYPLYTFAKDSKPGDAKGEGITSFGGTWTAISTAGQPVLPTGAGPTTTASSGGYGY